MVSIGCVVLVTGGGVDALSSRTSGADTSGFPRVMLNVPLSTVFFNCGEYYRQTHKVCDTHAIFLTLETIQQIFHFTPTVPRPTHYFQSAYPAAP